MINQLNFNGPRVGSSAVIFSQRFGRISTIVNGSVVSPSEQGKYLPHLGLK